MQNSSACETDCVSPNSWAVGVAVGTGNFSNPLHDGKERKLSVLPSFYYYGEKFYIENTKLGYIFEENEHWVFKAEGKFNNDGLYFNETPFDGLIIAGLLGPGNFVEPDESVSVSEVDRKLSYLGGFATDYYFTPDLKVSAGAYFDVSNVHNGYNLVTGIHYRKQIKDFYYSASLGVEHYSEKLNQYYYGLTAEDGTSYDKFLVGSNTNLSLSLSAGYRLNKYFSLVGQYNYQKLGKGMTVSPLVEDKYTSLFFIGISAQYGGN